MAAGGPENLPIYPWDLTPPPPHTTTSALPSLDEEVVIPGRS
jgi:hypothetical protein